MWPRSLLRRACGRLIGQGRRCLRWRGWERRFKADSANRGKICETGLWGWSRHPNYFFEWLGWVAFPLIALSGGDLIGLAAFAAPALMYVLLVHMSGVPPLEAHMERTRGAAFDDYRARVNVFFPGPPKP